MVFQDNAVVYPCDICHDRRKETFLGLIQQRVVVKEATHDTEAEFGQAVTVRYCNDNEDCPDSAPQLAKDLVQKSKKEWATGGGARYA